ncbi:MAG: MgtC/SapB family protein, partial [Candidatus Micrarchaeota archaeon]
MVKMFAIALNLLQKLVLAVAIGAIVGLEREHTKKQTLLGLRTFSLISLLGMILTELSKDTYYIASSIGLLGIFGISISF